MKYLLIVLALVTVLGVCLFPKKHEDFFITKPGEYALRGSSHLITVFLDKNEELNIRIVEPDRKVEWVDGFIDPDKNWLIYVDEINEIWLNYGDEVVFLYSFEDRSGSHSVNLYPNAKFKGSTLKKIIPTKFRNRLEPSTLEAVTKA